jgi:hypothetical protein
MACGNAIHEEDKLRAAASDGAAQTCCAPSPGACSSWLRGGYGVPLKHYEDAPLWGIPISIITVIITWYLALVAGAFSYGSFRPELQQYLASTNRVATLHSKYLSSDCSTATQQQVRCL